MTRSGLLFQNNTVAAAWRAPEESKDRRRETVQKLLSVHVEGMAGPGTENVVELSDILGGNQQYLGWVDLRRKRRGTPRLTLRSLSLMTALSRGEEPHINSGSGKQVWLSMACAEFKVP